MTEEPKHLVRTRRLSAGDATRIRHPLNPKAEVHIHRLADRVGMKRAILHLARVPPGKESFIPHYHGSDEEFVFILEGEGTALIGDRQVRVGPGDYMGFPADGTVHHLTNSGTADLVYLMGGERSAADIGYFPTLGKMAVFRGDTVRFYDERSAEDRPLRDWFDGPA
jgi:uncharacterized cupin superfamily protein